VEKLNLEQRPSVPRLHRNISNFSFRDPSDRVSDVFPPQTTTKPRHPVAFYTPQNPQASGLQVFLLGECFIAKGFFFNVGNDLQKVAALTRCHALGYFLSFLHLPSSKEIQTI